MCQQIIWKSKPIQIRSRLDFDKAKPSEPERYLRRQRSIKIGEKTNLWKAKPNVCSPLNERRAVVLSDWLVKQSKRFIRTYVHAIWNGGMFACILTFQYLYLNYEDYLRPILWLREIHFKSGVISKISWLLVYLCHLLLVLFPFINTIIVILYALDSVYIFSIKFKSPILYQIQANNLII